MALLGKQNHTPCNDSRIDYLMMRLPRLNEDFDDEADLDENLNEVEAGPGLNPALASALQFNRSTTSSIFQRKQSTLESGPKRTQTRLRTSVKVNLRSTESSLQLKNLQTLRQ